MRQVHHHEGRTLLAGRRAANVRRACIDGDARGGLMMMRMSGAQVRKVFEKLRGEDPGMWHVVDASMSLDQVTAKVSTSLQMPGAFSRRLQKRAHACAQEKPRVRQLQLAHVRAARSGLAVERRAAHVGRSRSLQTRPWSARRGFRSRR